MLSDGSAWDRRRWAASLIAQKYSEDRGMFFRPRFNDVFSPHSTTHLTTFYHAKNHVLHTGFSKTPCKKPLYGARNHPHFFRTENGLQKEI
jgi:hypothetical protein